MVITWMTIANPYQLFAISNQSNLMPYIQSGRSTVNCIKVQLKGLVNTIQAVNRPYNYVTPVDGYDM